VNDWIVKIRAKILLEAESGHLKLPLFATFCGVFSELYGQELYGKVRQDNP
jgi:hypothetical protein